MEQSTVMTALVDSESDTSAPAAMGQRRQSPAEHIQPPPANSPNDSEAETSVDSFEGESPRKDIWKPVEYTVDSAP